MPKVITNSIPVSPFCRYALRTEKGGRRFLIFVEVILIAVVWYFLSVTATVFTSVVIASIVAWALYEFKCNERKWLKINKRDYEVSLQLDEILKTYYHYSKQDIFNAGVAEEKIGSLWTPVYAQYFSGPRELSAYVSVSGLMGGLFGNDGTLSGTTTGSVGPDSLSDLGAVIVMRNEEGQSIRVIVPHRHVAEHMFAEALTSFNSAENTLRTLTSLQIFRMSTLLPARACTIFNSVLGVLDLVVGSVSGSPEERPALTLYGREVSAGVIMATAIEVDGICDIYVPTGYIKEVTDKLSQFLGPYRGDVKMLLDGKGPFATKET